MIREILVFDLCSKETQHPFSDYFGFKNPTLDFLKETHLEWAQRCPYQSARQKRGFGCLARLPLPKRSFAETFWHLFFTLKLIKISLPLTNKLSRALLTTLWWNKNCQILLQISSLPLQELRAFTFYLKITNPTAEVDLSSLPVIALPNSFPAI